MLALLVRPRDAAKGRTLLAQATVTCTCTCVLVGVLMGVQIDGPRTIRVAR